MEFNYSKKKLEDLVNEGMSESDIIAAIKEIKDEKLKNNKVLEARKALITAVENYAVELLGPEAITEIDHKMINDYLDSMEKVSKYIKSMADSITDKDKKEVEEEIKEIKKSSKNKQKTLEQFLKEMNW